MKAVNGFLHLAIFQGIPVKLIESRILGDLDFTRCPHAKIDEIGEFPQGLKEKLDERGITQAPIIKGPLEISATTLQDKILGASVVFLDISFNNSNLGIEVDFSNSVFVNEVDFIKAIICDFANFSGAIFGDGVKFTNANLGSGVSFQEANFGHGVCFSKARFHHSVSFDGTIFDGDTNFDLATFRDRALFTGTKFRADTSFENTRFGINVSFSHAHFSGDVTFSGAIFDNELIFEETHFIGDASFLKAIFGQRTSFELATFNKESTFDDTTFGDGVLFDRTSFKANVGFTRAIYKGSVAFQGRRKQEGDDDDKPVFHAVVKFNEVNFQAPEKVRFQTISLKKASFLNTRLDRVRFVDVNWDERDKRRALYDERAAKNEGDYELVAQLYRQLKKNYEEERDYPGAGDFYYGEMEMMMKQYRRSEKWYDWLFALEPQDEGKSKKLRWNPNWFNALLTTVYKRLSGYGEKPGLAFVWIGVILLVPALVYFIEKLVVTPNSGLVSSFAESLTESLAYMTVRLAQKPFSAWGKVFKLLQAILGPFQIALVALALRRKFRR